VACATVNVLINHDITTVTQCTVAYGRNIDILYGRNKGWKVIIEKSDCLRAILQYQLTFIYLFIYLLLLYNTIKIITEI